MQYVPNKSLFGLASVFCVATISLPVACLILAVVFDRHAIAISLYILAVVVIFAGAVLCLIPLRIIDYGSTIEIHRRIGVKKYNRDAVEVSLNFITTRNTRGRVVERIHLAYYDAIPL
jgi:hypothetical protein